ncbi:MAG: hypothetical protein ACXACI_02290 [Candidatus Hodarchaeales archaeon]|jgi:hypothetical protein
MPGAVVAIFDMIMGPKPIFFCGLEGENEATKIGIKSHVTFSMHDSQSPQSSGDAVVPFQELNKTAFVYLFEAMGQPATLSYVVDQSIQSSLYRSVHLLKVQAERLVEQVKSDLEDGKGQKLAKETQKLLKSWAAELPEFVEMTVEEEVLRKKITIKKMETEGSFSFLNKILKGEFEKIVGGLLREESVYVAGDRPMCELAIATLEAFCPQLPKKITWTDSYVPPGNATLIGIPRPLAKVYIGNVVVDLDSGKVEGGQKDSFAKKLVEITKKNPQKEAEDLIEAEIAMLVLNAKQLVEMCNHGSPSEEQFTKFRNDVGSDKYQFIVEIAINMDSEIKDLIPKDVGKRVADFLLEI